MLGAIRYSLVVIETALVSCPCATSASKFSSGKHSTSCETTSRNALSGFVPAIISSSSRPSCGPTNVFIMSLPSDWQSPFRPPAPPCPRSARAAVSRRPQLLGCNAASAEHGHKAPDTHLQGEVLALNAGRTAALTSASRGGGDAPRGGV